MVLKVSRALELEHVCIRLDYISSSHQLIFVQVSMYCEFLPDISIFGLLILGGLMFLGTCIQGLISEGKILITAIEI